jgi:hypothetical protein
MSRLDALAPRTYRDRDGSDKTAFTKVGSAFPNKSGDGYTVLLDAIPAPQDGQYKILLMTPKDRDDNRGGGGRQQSHQQPSPDDNIPF